MANEPTRELLETLAHALNCQYLSDLKTPALTDRLDQALLQLDPDTFAVKQWRDAMMYLTGKKCEAASAAEIKQALMDALTQAQ